LSNERISERARAEGRRYRSEPADDVGKRTWRGISGNASEDAARVTVRQFPALGSFIARLNVHEGGAITWEQTYRSDHFTLWGNPEALFACVEWVRPVEPDVPPGG
jgi:hypothetical protein